MDSAKELIEITAKVVLAERGLPIDDKVDCGLGCGDPNLGNCLWDGRRVALVDFEYAGWTDRAFELGDLVEHPQSRATPDAAWERFIDGFDLSDHERARAAAPPRRHRWSRFDLAIWDNRCTLHRPVTDYNPTATHGSCTG